MKKRRTVYGKRARELFTLHRLDVLTIKKGFGVKVFISKKPKTYPQSKIHHWDVSLACHAEALRHIHVGWSTFFDPEFPPLWWSPLAETPRSVAWSGSQSQSEGRYWQTAACWPLAHDSWNSRSPGGEQRKGIMKGMRKSFYVRWKCLFYEEAELLIVEWQMAGRQRGLCRCELTSFSGSLSSPRILSSSNILPWKRCS